MFRQKSGIPPYYEGCCGADLAKEDLKWVNIAGEMMSGGEELVFPERNGMK
jgi:hypothetical protein